MRFSTYLWHSVNLVPHGGYSTTRHDDKTYGRRYWATVFGVVVNLDVDRARKVRHFITPVLGPCWSRRNRRWYWPNEDGLLGAM